MRSAAPRFIPWIPTSTSPLFTKARPTPAVSLTADRMATSFWKAASCLHCRTVRIHRRTRSLRDSTVLPAPRICPRPIRVPIGPAGQSLSASRTQKICSPVRAIRCSANSEARPFLVPARMLVHLTLTGDFPSSTGVTFIPRLKMRVLRAERGRTGLIRSSSQAFL